MLVSPHRAQRPWLGQIDALPTESRPAHDPTCYLCPGNARAGGVVNPSYERTFVFTNDFAALLPDTPIVASAPSSLLRAESEAGTCRVACFSPRHDLTLAHLSVDEIRGVVDLWADQARELGQQYRWVQIFENKGEQMGASNPHPHCQIWAGSSLPDRIAREERAQQEYFKQHGASLLSEYERVERDQGDRVVEVNDDWLVVVPFWAVWPFETLLISRQSITRLEDLSDGQRTSLAAIMKRLLVRYDSLFGVPFPYSMGWHPAPPGLTDTSHWRLHAHYVPPLLRSATIRKFMVGYELLAEAQRDLTAEQAAERLRSVEGNASMPVT